MHKSCRRVSVRILINFPRHNAVDALQRFSPRHFFSVCAFLSRPHLPPSSHLRLSTNSIDCVGNFFNSYFKKRKSPTGSLTTVNIELFSFMYTRLCFVKTRRVFRHTIASTRSPGEPNRVLFDRKYAPERVREILGYQLFNRVGRFNPRNSQMFEFNRGNHVDTRPAL